MINEGNKGNNPSDQKITASKIILFGEHAQTVEDLVTNICNVGNMDMVAILHLMARK